MLLSVVRPALSDHVTSLTQSVFSPCLARVSRHGSLNFLKDIAVMDQDHYPERLGVIVVVNAPRVISIVWNFIKKYLDPITREKVVMAQGRCCCGTSHAVNRFLSRCGGRPRRFTFTTQSRRGGRCSTS